jgi:uncharacterized protein YqeY
MSFEEQLRAKISASPFQSDEKRLFKVILGEFQRKSVGKTPSDETGYNVVKAMIKANEENLARLREDDPRRPNFLEENRLMAGLLPKYWKPDEIRANLDVATIREATSDGAAMGMAMRALKALEAPVEGDVVKTVVAEIREN